MNFLAVTVLAMLVLAGGPASAGDECEAPAQTWQPRAAVRELAARNGWRVEHLKIDNGCYEIKGRDAEGRRFKATLDPATLEVLDMKRQRDGHGRAQDERHATPPSGAQRGSSNPGAQSD